MHSKSFHFQKQWMNRSFSMPTVTYLCFHIYMPSDNMLSWTHTYTNAHKHKSRLQTQSPCCGAIGHVRLVPCEHSRLLASAVPLTFSSLWYLDVASCHIKSKAAEHTVSNICLLLEATSEPFTHVTKKIPHMILKVQFCLGNRVPYKVIVSSEA